MRWGLRAAFVLSVTLNMAGVAFVAHCLSVRGWAISYAWDRLTEKGSRMADTRKSVFAVSRPVDGGVVFLGDSLVEMGEWSEWLPGRVYNRGVGGDSVRGVLDRLASVTAMRPAAIVLLIGTNDLGHPAEYIVSRIGVIVSRVQSESPGTMLYLTSLPPTGPDNWRSAERIHEVNTGLADLCDGNRVVLVDLHRAVEDSNGMLRADYTFDGLHLNGEAYKAWIAAIGQHVHG